jgi:predicted nucleic acid-binding protein
MKTVFADSHYWLAVTNPNDPWAEAAKTAKASVGQVLLLTTDEVLTEFLAGMSKGGSTLRRTAVHIVRTIMGNPNVRVVAQSRDTFLRALEHYAKREDKQYSLVDCASMNTMEASDVREVLTNDHHFEQEGYVVLIK